MPKLDLAVILIYWTTHFIYDKKLEPCHAGQKGIDYFANLLDLLAKDKRVKEVCSIFC